MTHRYDIAITATLVSPFILPGLDVAGLGVDTAALRDEAGRPLIPGDQVKGLLRAAMVSLCGAGAASKQDLTYLFGRPSDKGGKDDPARGALITADLVAHDADCTPGKHHITRIKINEATGAVQDGALQVVELVAPPGAAVTFTGMASLRCAPDAATRLIDLLLKAWKLLPAIGGAKSAGFGRVMDVTLVLNGTGQPLLPTAAAVSTYDDTIWLDVYFDRRLLVDAQRLSDNVWRGSSIVPGTAIKGALARVLDLAGAKPTEAGRVVGQALQTIRIGHALPLGPQGDLLDLPIPQSAVMLEPLHAGAAADKKVRDVLLCARKVPLGPNGEVPIYQGDWKGDEDRTDLPPSSDIPRLPRIHTRIGEHYTAKDGDLYVDIGLSPWLDAGQHWARCWRLRIDRRGADKGWYQRFVDILLQQGLDGVGTTGARARFTLASKPTPPVVEPTSPGAQRWAVTLITPTLMLPKDGVKAGCLYKPYAYYWRAALGKGVRLVNFYATHRLAGGYIGIRRRHYGEDCYRPFLLTEPGSVFLLEGDIGTGLRNLMDTGLPVRDVGPGDWRTCPFLPENGFGDFRLNLIDHQKRLVCLFKGTKELSDAR